MTTRISALLTLTLALGSFQASTDAQCRSSRYPSPGYHRPIVPHRPIQHHRSVQIHQITHRPDYHPVRPVDVYDSINALPIAPTCSAFGGCVHVDEFAVRLQVIMHELCMDMYFNYSHNPGFRESYADAYSLYQLAKGIHDSAHLRNYDSMRAQLAGADVIFHRLESYIQGWTRMPRRQVGTLGMITKMGMAEDTLHMLMKDLGVVSNPFPQEPPTPGQIGLPGVPASPLQVPGTGFDQQALLSIPNPPALPIN